MFVEHITTYNFDIATEWDDYKKYSKVLKGWEVIEKGTKTIALEKHESIWVDLTNKDKKGEQI